ncbi:MAG TPA: PRC-barrel domain-containing protein [Rhizobiaceae bacterium]|nr:PRC-barrel domain-containing protein [Rhizobiaceae bacterium]
MIRILFAATAVASMIATGAIAQTTNAPAASPTQQQNQPANPPGTKPATEMRPKSTGQEGDHLATQLMGKAVYNGNGKNARNIGDVTDIVIGKDGKVRSVVVGVGGFLGMGAKNVAIDYNQVKWEQHNGAWTIVVPTTADQLKSLPDFDRSAYEAGPVAGTGTARNNPGLANGGMTASGSGVTATAPGSNAANISPDTGDTTGAIDKNSLKKVDVGTISANDLIGTKVYGANNADLGSISDVVLDKQGKIDAIVVDVGGFLGMGTKRVAIGMTNLQFLADKNGRKYLYTPLTKDQLQKQPTYDKATYAANRNKMRMTVQ